MGLFCGFLLRDVGHISRSLLGDVDLLVGIFCGSLLRDVGHISRSLLNDASLICGFLLSVFSVTLPYLWGSFG